MTTDLRTTQETTEPYGEGTPDLSSARPRPVSPSLFRRRLRSVVKHVLLIGLSLLMIYPLIWLVVSSMKPNEQIFTDLSIFTTDLSFDNYIQGWDAQLLPFHVYLLNSSILVIGAIVGNLISCSMAAYAFARLDFRFRTITFAVMLGTILLPFHVVLVPQFILFREMGWLDTFLPLVVPKFMATEAFFVFLMVQFIRSLPNELYEAARIDGAGHFRQFVQITLPLMIPALATTTIFTFIWTWADFFGPLIYLRSPENYVVPQALNMFIDGQSTSNFGAMFAMSVISLIPMFIAFLIGQKFLVKGFAKTGIK
ncbi:carbohydrate ABC transporter permease [Nesterenkonia haasae]|uniref:carbohydrate ABC transporter permease n=1 Tax=Nesterenkonia haasae TaxID=2587813 RepID=UPI0013917922|nr:carbohydrate ABC transporter permease [Nesterenkonia haasae]NDK30285.1 carbohydrate ABC transporter permease [Nesterenkonia haasae]